MMRKIAFLLVFLFSTVMAFSQTRTIKGKVIDESGSGLPGATVQIKGTQKGSVTDVDGNYSIVVPTEGGALVVSYVGYTSQEVAIGQSDEININLALDVQNLEQVVVVGYGVQKKSLVTGSISKIESKDITAMPATRVEQALCKEKLPAFTLLKAQVPLVVQCLSRYVVTVLTERMTQSIS